MAQSIAIHWFRQDLRVYDNPALNAAATNHRLLPIFILDDENAEKDKPGSASRWWLHHSLSQLNDSLKGNLRVFNGRAETVLARLVDELDIAAVYWNRCYEPWRTKRDRAIKAMLSEAGADAHSYNGSLLWEPWQICKKDGTPYKVFTPFYKRGCLQAAEPRKPSSEPTPRFAQDDVASLSIKQLNLLPQIPWDKQLEPHWTIGEKGAQEALKSFIDDGLNDYKDGRNFPAKNRVSRLSPHLHWGEISPNQIWHDVHAIGDGENESTLLSELGWREFSYSLLFYFPELRIKNWQDKFDQFPWQHNKEWLKAWQMGKTGYPIVDAGMRELWQTGYIHNRVRMIVGSFLVKNLRIHWRHGEQWFWDCLVDADHASNSASWQWVAGCGADAAPYFRIFNPITQGEKFDPSGEYTRHYVPELQALPDKYLYKPWEAPPEVLSDAGVNLGSNYPSPIIDLKQSRNEALEAYQMMRS